MKAVALNCKVHLRFEDGEGTYLLSPFSSTKQFNEISIVSPIGRAILGRAQGDEIEFFNSKNESVKVKIVRVSL
jgi:transcription elongation GreA/GreB family factor